MMVADATYFEALLREALTPVDPPADLVERLESTLETITELAADELEAWELRAMRDPRNWVRPAAAVVAGGAAGTALVLLRARRRAHATRLELEAQHGRSLTLEGAEQVLRELGEQARKLLGER
jgi:hypothetical protein